MNYKTGKADHIEDILIRMHEGHWFSWSDSKNKIYANLILNKKMGVDGEMIDNPHTLPTEKELTDALAKEQSDFDAQAYAKNRASSFPSFGDQLDMMYWDNKNGTTTHADAIAKVKSDNPKPE